MSKIAFIAPRFFGLEETIMNQMIKSGNEVYFYDERVNSSKINKILIRLNPNVIKKKIDQYYKKILLDLVEKRIEVLFVIKAETVPIWFLESVKINHPDIIRIHYMYDPIENYPKIFRKIEFFDYAVTFDYNDAIKHNWLFRPLFYADIHKRGNEQNNTYLASFVGTVHSDRSEVLERIINAIPKEADDVILKYFYIPLKLMFYKGKLLDNQFTNISAKDVMTQPLSPNETAEIIKKSLIIIDVHHPSQSGLTTRTLESIGARRKLITTNPAIMDYDFFDEDNILIVGRENPIIPIDWINREYKDLPENQYMYYSIEGFVETFIELIKIEKSRIR